MQVRRQGEADAELRRPVIKAVVSPPPQRQPGPDLVRGGMEGTGGRRRRRRGELEGEKNSSLGDVGLDTTSKLTQTQRPADELEIGQAG